MKQKFFVSGWSNGARKTVRFDDWDHEVPSVEGVTLSSWHGNARTFLLMVEGSSKAACEQRWDFIVATLSNPKKTLWEGISPRA